MPQRAQRGITVVELVFTTAVLAVLASISLPALASVVRSAQARTARGLLAASLAQARLQAIARATQVSLCPSRNQTTCTGGTRWQDGWIAFVDANGNGRRDIGEALLEAAPAQPGVGIASSAGRPYASFRSDGAAPGNNLTLALCDRRGAADATSLVVNNGGRVRAGKPAAALAAQACAALE